MMAERDFKPSARRKARRFALQGLYEWQLSGNPVHEIEARCHAENDLRKTDVLYLGELLQGVVREQAEIDRQLQSFIDRKVSELTPIEHVILALAAYELNHRRDIPYQVIINEAVELAKDFGASESHRYVNGVLDAWARQVRADERAAR